MRSWPMAAALGLGLALAGDLSAQALASKPSWQSDYAKARAEAKRTGKLLFVVFRCQP